MDLFTLSASVPVIAQTSSLASIRPSKGTRVSDGGSGNVPGSTKSASVEFSLAWPQLRLWLIGLCRRSSSSVCNVPPWQQAIHVGGIKGACHATPRIAPWHDVLDLSVSLGDGDFAVPAKSMLNLQEGRIEFSVSRPRPVAAEFVPVRALA